MLEPWACTIMYRKPLQQIRQMENVSAMPYDQVKVELGHAS